MKPLLLALLLAVLPTGPGAAFFGSSPPDQTGLVWVPAETFSDWAGLTALLDRREKLSFTVALTAVGTDGRRAWPFAQSSKDSGRPEAGRPR